MEERDERAALLLLPLVEVADDPGTRAVQAQGLDPLRVGGGEGDGDRIDMLNRPVAEVHAVLDAQTHRRIIKTHTPLDGVPFRHDVHYVVVGRDPRDVAISWDHHLANLDLERLFELRATAVDPADDWLPPLPEIFEDPADRFQAFIHSDDDGILNLVAVLHHLWVGWERRHEPNVHLLHYSDLLADLPGELWRLGRALGFAITPERAAELARHAEIEEMRTRATEVVPSASMGLWRDTSQFIRTGGRGEWQALATAADDDRYHRRVSSLVADDLARWVHDGASAHAQA